MCVEHSPRNRLTNRSEDSPGGEWRHRNERECRCQDVSATTTANGIGNTAPTTNGWSAGSRAQRRSWHGPPASAAVRRPDRSSSCSASRRSQGLPRAARSAPRPLPRIATAPASATAIARNGATDRGSRPTSVPRLSPPNPGCRPMRRTEAGADAVDQSRRSHSGTPRGTLTRQICGAARQALPPASFHSSTSRRGSSACVARSGAGRTLSPTALR